MRGPSGCSLLNLACFGIVFCVHSILYQVCHTHIPAHRTEAPTVPQRHQAAAWQISVLKLSWKWTWPRLCSAHGPIRVELLLTGIGVAALIPAKMPDHCLLSLCYSFLVYDVGDVVLFCFVFNLQQVHRNLVSVSSWWALLLLSLSWLCVLWMGGLHCRITQRSLFRSSTLKDTAE